MSPKVAAESNGLQPTDKFGEKHKFDEQFKGPTKQRHCTDIFCLVIFIAFMVGWGIVSSYSLIVGNPATAFLPKDSHGRACGADKGVKDKPYLYFFDILKCASPSVPFKGCRTPQVCVERCPTTHWFYQTDGRNGNKSELLCSPEGDVKKAFKSINELVNKKLCAAYYVKSRSIAGRCLPTTSSFNELVANGTSRFRSGEPMNARSLFESVHNLYILLETEEFVENIGNDLQSTIGYLVGLCVLVMLISFLWIFLIRLTASAMVWTSFVLFTALFGFGSYYFFTKYLEMHGKAKENEAKEKSLVDYEKLFAYASENETFWLVLFIIFISVFLIVVVVFLFLRKRIKLAIALLTEASKSVSHICSSLFFPAVPHVLHTAFLVLFCLVAFLLETGRIARYNVICEQSDCSCSQVPENSTCYPQTFKVVEGCDAQCSFLRNERYTGLVSLHLYNLVSFIWAMFFVTALSEMILACVFSIWYWTFNKKRLPATPMLDGIYTVFRYHLGTVAFGSLIITIVRLIRIMFEYIDHKVKQYADNWFFKCISCCCRCCLWCVEKFLKFINRNAYIYCAIYGKNFCSSARHAFNLLMRNIVRVVVLDKVTDFILLIGKLVITIGMGFLTHFLFNGAIYKSDHFPPDLHSTATPVILIVFASYFISSSFFDVFSMAVDTLFFCFLEDSERNDGSAEKPYFMSKRLRKILNKKNEPRSE